MGQESLITIGKMASRTGVNVSAIRFYADQGLIPVHRNSGGHRLFHRSVIRRVSFILIAQQLGYTLDQIRAQLSQLPPSDAPTAADWRKFSRTVTRDIDERIERLTTLRESLQGCIGCGCLSLSKCRLYNPDDRAAALGTGPRYLLGDRAADVPKNSN